MKKQSLSTHPSTSKVIFLRKGCVNSCFTLRVALTSKIVTGTAPLAGLNLPRFLKNGNCPLKTRNCTLKTRNCILKTRLYLEKPELYLENPELYLETRNHAF